MARKHRTTQDTGRVVLLIDDNREYLRSTERILTRAGHRVLTAESGKAGLEIVKTERVELILVDFLMPEMTGEEFVRELRTFDKGVQVILQTGYAQELPPAAMLRKLDIQGYHEKSDGPYKLLLWTDVGLQSARTVRRLDQIRSGLAHLLEISREGEPFEHLLQHILQQATNLLGIGDSCIVLMEGDAMTVAAGTGRFQLGDQLSSHMEPVSIDSIRQALSERRAISADGCFAMPLRVGEVSFAIVHLEQPTDSIDLQLLQLFAHQASMAIDNAKLHERACVDEPTGLFTRRYFEHALLRELRICHRSRQPVSVLRIGYQGSQRPVSAVSDVIKKSTRATDVVGFYGEQEFAIVLPNTDAVGAGVVADRIMKGMETAHLTANVGVAALTAPDANTKLSVPETYFRSVASDIIQHTVPSSGPSGAASFDWPPLDA